MQPPITPPESPPTAPSEPFETQPIKVVTGNLNPSKSKWKGIVLDILVGATVWLILFLGTFIIGYLAWILGIVILVAYIKLRPKSYN